MAGVMQDLYEVLGVSEDATQDEIKKSYRNLSKKHHPDRGGDEEKFKEISAAYSVLSDQQERAKYDRKRQFGGRGGGSWHEDPFGFEVNFRGATSVEDIFEQFVRKHRKQSAQGFATRKNLQVNLSWEEARDGCKKKVRLYAEGPQASADAYEVEFPAGVPSGYSVPVDTNNNVYVVASVETPPGFQERRGLDVYKQIKLNVLQCVTGTTIRLKNPYGTEMDVTIPPGTENGNRFLVSDEGVKFEGETGNVILQVVHEMPHVTEEQRQKIKEVIKMGN